METDRKIDIAKKIAKELIDVKRTEWTKWVEYYKLRRDLTKAISFSHVLSESLMLRAGQKRSYGRISSVMMKNKMILEGISVNETFEIFGYVGWLISTSSGFG